MNTYQFCNYLFRTNKPLDQIIGQSNNTFYFNNPEAVAIFQFASDHHFGELREIIIQDGGMNSFELLDSEIYFISLDRFLSFVNEEVDIKNFFDKLIPEKDYELV